MALKRKIPPDPWYQHKSKEFVVMIKCETTGNLFIIDTIPEMQGDLNEKEGNRGGCCCWNRWDLLLKSYRFANSHPEVFPDKPVMSPASFLTRSNWHLPQQGPSLSTRNFLFPLQCCILLFDFVGVITHLLTCMYLFSAPRLGRLRAGRHHP